MVHATEMALLGYPSAFLGLALKILFTQRLSPHEAEV
jgi:hypothetical protein